MELFTRDSNYPDVGPTIIGVSLGLVLFASILVAIRIVHRLRAHSFGWDEAFITAALVISIAHSVVDCISVYLWGYGKHEADLTPERASAVGENLGFWLAQIMYKVVILFTKFSICLLYRRIFERAGHKFTYALYALMALIVCYYTGAFLVTIFECSPVYKSWIKNTPGTCINNGLFYEVNAGFNISTDVFIMLLPLPVIKALHLSLRQKLVLGLVFAVGFIATITSIYRVFTLPTSAQQLDFTWNIAQGVLWTSAEMNTAIICA